MKLIFIGWLGSSSISLFNNFFQTRHKWQSLIIYLSLKTHDGIKIHAKGSKLKGTNEYILKAWDGHVKKKIGERKKYDYNKNHLRGRNHRIIDWVKNLKKLEKNMPNLNYRKKIASIQRNKSKTYILAWIVVGAFKPSTESEGRCLQSRL